MDSCGGSNPASLETPFRIRWSPTSVHANDANTNGVAIASLRTKMLMATAPG
jgi:hypothetical protein